MNSQDILYWLVVAAASGCASGYSAQREPFPHGTDLAAWEQRRDPLGLARYQQRLRQERAGYGSLAGVVEILLGVLDDNRERRNFNWPRFAKGFAAGFALVICARFALWPLLVVGVAQV